jgi:Tfp pilus assembly protein PilZ
VLLAKIERRKQNRIKYEAFISHDILSDEIIHSDKMFNFSQDGLYFESNQNIHPGDDVYIGIGYHPHQADDNIQLLFGVEVVWRKDLQDSSYRYGFGSKFISSNNSLVKEVDIGNSLLKKSKMKELEKQSLSGQDVKAEGDSRKHPRKPCKKLLIFTYKNQQYKGLVTSISRGGAFLITESKLALGEIINLVIQKRKNSKDLKVKAWIVRSTPKGVGVSFDRRSGKERRYDLDRRTGLDRRRRGHNNNR